MNVQALMKRWIFLNRFQGEEISIGLRAFTFGYDFYAPEHSVCFHAYIKNENDGIVAVFTEHANLYEG